MNNMMFVIIAVVCVMIDMMICYLTGKVLGGTKVGRIVAVTLTVVSFVVCSIVSVGGSVSELVLCYQYIPGFGFGQLIGLSLHIYATIRGTRRHLIYGKEKWLI